MMYFYFISCALGNLRLGRVCGLGAVADVLCGMEDPEGESSQKVAGREQTGHRAKPETCARCRRGTDR